jgi:hypothetical protein
LTDVRTFRARRVRCETECYLILVSMPHHLDIHVQDTSSYVLALAFLQLCTQNALRFVTLGLESDIYTVIERLKKPLVEDVTTQLLF